MSDQVEVIINRLFTELKGIYPAWKAAFGNQAELDEAKRQWLKGFIEAELNQWEWIERGLSKCRQQDTPFLPSVGMFIELCRIEQPTPYQLEMDRVNKAVEKAKQLLLN